MTETVVKKVAKKAAPAEPEGGAGAVAVAEDTNLELLKSKIREIADYFCVWYSLCDAVYDYLWDKAYGLDLGPKPKYDTHTFNISVAGFEKEVRFNGRSQEAAIAAYMREIGATAPGITPLVLEGEQSEAVAKLKDAVKKAGQAGIDNGRITVSRVNEGLRALGIEEIPTLKRFAFDVLAMPVAPRFRYRVDAYTEAEAREKLADKIKRDEGWIDRAEAEGGIYHRDQVSEYFGGATKSDRAQPDVEPTLISAVDR